MKKALIYTLIIILVAIISITGTYYFIKVNQEQPENRENKKPIELISTKEENDKIVQKFNLYLNGSNKEFEIIYTRKNNIFSNGEKQIDNIEGLEVITGTLNGTKVYQNEIELSLGTKTSGKFNKNFIETEFTTENFRIIKGKDNKEYLALNTVIYDGYIVPSANFLIVYNSDLKIISNLFDDISNCSNEKTSFFIHYGPSGAITDKRKWYENTFKYSTINSKNTLLKIENDKIYYLYPNVKYKSENDWGTFEERIYTINDDKLEYKRGNTYKITSMAGQSC